MARARRWRRVPLQDVEDDSGEEAGFRHAQQKAGGVELHRRADEHHRHGDDAPGDHNAGEPAARAEAVEQEVGGDLAGGVAEEEEARAEAIDGVGEVKIGVHLELGVADVDAIHVGDAVAERDERNQPPSGFAEGGAGDGIDGCWGEFGRFNGVHRRTPSPYSQNRIIYKTKDLAKSLFCKINKTNGIFCKIFKTLELCLFSP